MIRQWALTGGLAGLILCFGTQVSAQPGGKGSIKQLEDEVTQLKAKLEAAEKKLKDAKASSEKRGEGKRGFGRGPIGKGGFGPFGKGKFDPEKMKEMKERFEKFHHHKGEKKSAGETKKESAKETTADKLADVEKQLLKLTRQLDEIRRSLRR